MKRVLSLFIFNKLKSLYLGKSCKKLRKKKIKTNKEVKKGGREKGKKVMKRKGGIDELHSITNKNKCYYTRTPERDSEDL